MDNHHRDILLSNHQLLSEIATHLIGDVDQLARIVEILRPIYDERIIWESFQGTYRGNAALVVQGALSREAAMIISRLFAKPRQKNKKGDINFEMSDRSLILASTCFCEEIKAQRLFDRDSFRWGASGSFAVVENGATRQLSLKETLRRRIRAGKESIKTNKTRLDEAAREISEFSLSKDYGKIRVFRTEKIAHALPASNDRKAYKLGEDDIEITYDEIDRIAIRALAIAEKAITAMFRRSLSINDQRDIWSAYARLFWAKAAGAKLENTLNLQEDK